MSARVRTWALAWATLTLATAVYPLAAQEPAESAPQTASTRIGGVMPNFLTTDGKPGEDPLPASRKFSLAARNTFDPFVFTLVGVMAATHESYGGGLSGYGKQYAASFTDNTVGNLLTSAALPSLLHQDPRYYRRGQGSVAGRLGYALSRTLASHGDSGRTQLNVSELGGTAIAAGVSNLYYPRDARTGRDTATRMGLQVMWDGLANALKEFWPDVQRKLKHR